MPHGQDKRDEFLRPLLESAENGDRRAARFLVKLGSNLIGKGDSLPPRLRAFFLRVLNDPAWYVEIMTTERKKSRGRPSIDSGSTAEVVGLRISTPFGSRPTECNALAIHHLLLQGHTLNIAGTLEKESAVELLAELTGRSTRSLQSDYAKHKRAILQMGSQSAEESARVAYQRLVSLAELRRIHGT